MRITDETCESAVCPPGRKDVMVFDDAIPGFGIRVTENGRRVFIFQYRSGPQVRRTVIGRWGELSAKQARKAAETLRGRVREDRDPVAEKRAKAAATAEAEAKARAARIADGFTVEKLVDAWAAHHLVQRSASYRKRVPSDLRRGLATWINQPARSLTRADAVRALDDAKAASGPIAANRLRAAARACWGWAVKRGALDASPWDLAPRPSVEAARERVLADAEIAMLWQAASLLGPPWEGIFKMLVLSGQRRGEVAGMEWGELDLVDRLWTLPGARTKNGRSHVVPLTDAMMALLPTKRRVGSLLVFEGARWTAPSGFGKVKERLDVALRDAAVETDRAVPPWTIHDIRRTVATGLQRLGVRLEVTEAILNHVSGSRSGIAGVYQRYGWEREKRAALEGWAAHVMACVDAEKHSDSKIVRLNPRSAGGPASNG